MATKIRRCLYIGLGGTGMNTLLRVKKLLIDTYGEVPPMIGFLGIDADKGVYKKELKSRHGDVVQLQPNEQLHLPTKTDSPRDYLVNNPEHFGWLHENNYFAIDSLKGIGAGQIRSNGRYLFIINQKDVENKIKTIIDQISNAQIAQNKKYDLLQSNSIDVHMVFSICGGTGCGTFIDMAFLIKDILPTCKLSGYGVLPDVFEAMSQFGMEKVKPNAYGAIQDLDYIMNLDLGQEPVVLDWLTRVKSSNERPFNAFYFIDNKNENGDTYNQVDQLADMVSLALVTAAGELSVATASVSDNVEKNIASGDMNIANKKAWVSTMGVCEILYHGDELKELYAYKAIKSLIDQLKNTNCIADDVVNTWIDSTEVNIRENRGKDNVIDYILSKNPPYQFSDITDGKNPHPEVQGYLNTTAKPEQQDVDQKVANLTNRVKKELRSLISSQLNKECGIGNTEKILDSLNSQLEIFINEMNEELKDFKNNRLPHAQSSLKSAETDLENYCLKIIKSQARKQEYKNSVIDLTTNVAINDREIIRREAAVTFFSAIKQEVANYKTRLKAIKDNLNSVYNTCTQRISEIQNNVGKKAQTFQIDLTTRSMNEVVVMLDQVNLNDFLLKNKGFIENCDNQTSDVILEEMKKYAENIEFSKTLSEKSVENIIDSLTKEEFERLIKTAIIKSTPMLKFDAKGRVGQQQAGDYYYIGVEDKNHSRLAQDNYFKNNVSGNPDVSFSSVGLKDRIIIYRQKGVVPAFEMAPLFAYENKYNQCRIFCHIDKNLYTRLKSESYNLLPENPQDDTLELWVKGFIFGYIKNENNMYSVMSQSMGDAIDNYWYELDQHRDLAYQKFKSHISDLKDELIDKIVKFEKDYGVEAVKNLYAKVKAIGAYKESYSQLNMTDTEIKLHGNESIRSLIRDEINYVTKVLGKELDS